MIRLVKGVLGVLGLGTHVLTVGEEPQYNLCRKQIVANVVEVFGE